MLQSRISVSVFPSHFSGRTSSLVVHGAATSFPSGDMAAQNSEASTLKRLTTDIEGISNTSTSPVDRATTSRRVCLEKESE